MTFKLRLIEPGVGRYLTACRISVAETCESCLNGIVVDTYRKIVTCRGRKALDAWNTGIEQSFRSSLKAHLCSNL